MKKCNQKQLEHIFSVANLKNLKKNEISIPSEPRKQIRHGFLQVKNSFYYFPLSSLLMSAPDNFQIKYFQKQVTVRQVAGLEARFPNTCQTGYAT